MLSNITIHTNQAKLDFNSHAPLTQDSNFHLPLTVNTAVKGMFFIPFLANTIIAYLFILNLPLASDFPNNWG